MAEQLGSKVQRLAKSIVAGDVVFFIGAGFSLESEGNSATVLIARLLARFEAITTAVCGDRDLAGTRLATLCGDLREALQSIFQVKPDRRGALCGKFFQRNVTRLARDYYQINDWMCSAFDALLEHCETIDRLAMAIQIHELIFRRNFANKKSRTPLYMPPVDFTMYRVLVSADEPRGSGGGQATAGKALFLDTMGFADSQVMAGKPLAEFDVAMRSYQNRLRDRHSRIAWLALEGLLPVVLTTNYDLLIEGAYRMAGMQARVPESPPAPVAARLDWNRRLRFFTPISDATQFFSYGDGYASALILKIHGCVRSYREHRRIDDAANWRRTLRTMVFTFREIQNWRDDSWSRDYIQTLLRTRTVAFAGYSTADPVMHDTFRSVYEEMAGYRVPARNETAAVIPADREKRDAGANAFFFQYGSRTQFHGIEILRAASRAVGDSHPDLTHHANLIEFAGGSGFPTLDELMTWIYHVAYRELQQQAIASELRRVSYQLFRHPAPDREVTRLEADFESVLKSEREALADLPAAADASRNRFRRIVAWTVGFHRNVMREYAAADLILRNPESARRVRNTIRWPWYAPLAEHPDWAAWAIVLELAIRKRGAQWCGSGDWLTVDSEVEPVVTDRAAVLIPGDRKTIPGDTTKTARSPRVCLSVELPGVRDELGRARPFRMIPPIVWQLRSHTIPWWLAGDAQCPDSTPDPLVLWDWAISSPAAPKSSSNSAHSFFGGRNVGNARSGQHSPAADGDAGQPRAAPMHVDRDAAGV